LSFSDCDGETVLDDERPEADWGAHVTDALNDEKIAD